MESRRLTIYLIAILAILIGMLVYLFVQVRQVGPETAERNGKGKIETDLADGGAIFLKGKNLEGKMIPISGGPPWFLAEGGGCTACHGDKGEGGRPVRDMKIVPPNIKKAVSKGIGGMSEEDFARLIRWGERPRGKPLSYEMPRFDLSADEVRDLLSFIREL